MDRRAIDRSIDSGPANQISCSATKTANEDTGGTNKTGDPSQQNAASFGNRCRVRKVEQESAKTGPVRVRAAVELHLDKVPRTKARILEDVDIGDAVERQGSPAAGIDSSFNVCPVVVAPRANSIERVVLPRAVVSDNAEEKLYRRVRPELNTVDRVVGVIDRRGSNVAPDRPIVPSGSVTVEKVLLPPSDLTPPLSVENVRWAPVV